MSHKKNINQKKYHHGKNSNKRKCINSDALNSNC